jgi:phosphate/sulfate permease
LLESFCVVKAQHNEAIMIMQNAVDLKCKQRLSQLFGINMVNTVLLVDACAGANDVANAIGSFCAAFYVYQNMAVGACSLAEPLCRFAALPHLHCCAVPCTCHPACCACANTACQCYFC